MRTMHEYTEDTEDLARAILAYARGRIASPQPLDRSAPADVLSSRAGETITPSGIGWEEALRIWSDVLAPATISTDHPAFLAFVPGAPTKASVLFDLVISASSTYGGSWLEGAGAVWAENQTLRWLADLAGLPVGAGGCFVSGGIGGNLSALVAARHAATQRRGSRPARWTIASADTAHSSVGSAARVMDVDLIEVPHDPRGRLTGDRLDAVLDSTDVNGVFAVVASAGSTNAGIVDDLRGVADVCAERELWLHVDGAYGGAAAHLQEASYLDSLNVGGEWNASDYAHHLTRRPRGLPLWFSLATYGTDAYRDAVEAVLELTRQATEEIRRRPGLQLVADPELSVILFRREGWAANDYERWWRSLLDAQVPARLAPTRHPRFTRQRALRNPLLGPPPPTSSVEVDGMAPTGPRISARTSLCAALTGAPGRTFTRRMGDLMASKDDEKIQNAARLAALRRTALLDTPPEEAFDRLTRLATRVLRVPVALVSMVDGDRQFFKSCIGLQEPLASLRQTPLTHSFCKHAVASGEPFVVSDAREHPLVRNSPAVSELGVIAYAGIPLTTTEGHTLGTFCVVDDRPREWTEEDIEILRSLAASVMTEIETRRLAEELRSLSTDLQQLVEARTSQLSRAEERWRVLLRVNNAVVTCLDRDTLLGATAAALRDVIPFDRAALVLDDPIKGVFRVLGVAGPVPSPSTIPIGTEWPRRGSRSGWITDSGRPLLTADLREDPRFVEHGSLVREGILSALSVPLKAKDKILGTLNVGSREVGRYGEEDSELLLAIADQVVLAIQNMLAYEEIGSLKHRLEQENLYLQEEVRAEAAFADVVGESPAIQKVLASIRRVAGTESTVLVTGETGTGKELVVRAIHGLSGRKDKIFVKVNCAALPSGVIESELFGHEKGAFTGALTRRVGRFELANGGTLFLDEVGDLPLELQAKLLRVLQEGEFERVGGTQTLKMDVRMIAATNRNLSNAVEEGRFRADLFYRLNVFPIAIPPLRERLEDIPRLTRHFAMIYGSKMGKTIGTISEQVLDKLMEYSWPGNVRELQNVIERAVILSTNNRLELDDSLAAPVAGARTKSARTLEEIERDHILSVLKSVGWRVSGERGAARILGLKRTTLEARMSRLGISRPS